MQNKISDSEVKKWIEKFNSKLILELDNKISKKDYAGHFSRWLSIELSKRNKNLKSNAESFAKNR